MGLFFFFSPFWCSVRQTVSLTLGPVQRGVPRAKKSEERDWQVGDDYSGRKVMRGSQLWVGS